MQITIELLEEIIYDELDASDLYIKDCDGSIDRDWTKEEFDDVIRKIVDKIKKVNDK